MVTLTLRLPNGKRKYFRGETREEAEKKRDECQSLIDQGFNLCNDCNVKQLALAWLEESKARTRETTYLTRKSLVENAIIPALGSMKPRDVKTSTIKALVRELSKSYAKKSQRNIIGALRSIFDMAIEDEIIMRNPVVKSIAPIGEDTEDRESFTDAQCEELLNTFRGTVLYPFVLLGLSAGLRKGELLGLMWKDIDFDTGILTVSRTVTPSEFNRSGVLREDTKTKCGRRSIPLTDAVLDELREIKSHSHSVYVVCTRKGAMMSLPGAGQAWSNRVKHLDFYATPHMMRHTRITRWIEQGLDIKETQYLAGHADPALTLAVYTHYRFEDRFENTVNKVRGLA